MNLTTLNNQFHFNLPLDFIPAKYEERYMKLLGDKRKIYASVLDYLNSTIQGITFPGIAFPTVSNPQILMRKQIKWKTVGNIYDLFDKTITVTFLNVDSNVNYIIFMDILMNHYLNVEKPYDAPLIITVIDQNRNALYHIQFRDVIWTGVSPTEFAFNDQTVQTKNFTLTFEYNFIDFEYVADKIDIISKNGYNNLTNLNPPN
jgi:hypothetical protein